jgi:hypothetical protein
MKSTLFIIFCCLQMAACQSQLSGIETVRQFLDARQRKDEAAYLKWVAPDMRIWYEEKRGAGNPWNPKSAWANWDDFFRGTKTFGTFRQDSNAVTVVVTETNDFFTLIERPPSQVQLTWWLDSAGKIKEYLVKSVSGSAVPDRLGEFQQWASRTDSLELAYLMPEGRINPEGDRPQRWKNILLRWRETLGGQAGQLSIKFIGNAAFEISDGVTTLLSDYPYQSGAFGYMNYNPKTVQPKGRVLCLITHEHADHFAPELLAPTDWFLAAHPKVKANLPAERRLHFADTMRFSDIQILPIQTPHTDAHCSFLVIWKGKRFYFTGDTDALDFLPKEKVDVLFITPWLLEMAQKSNLKLNAEQLVVHHHRSGEKVECSGCVVPAQGQEILIEN